MSKTTIFNSYDDTKKMLNKIREIQSMSKNKYEIIQEQIDSDDNNHLSQNETSEDEDFAVINNVEIEIHSGDPEDMELSDEEKGKISQ